MSATGSTRGSAATRIWTTTLSGAIYRIAPKGFVSKVPTFDAATIDGLITALRSPAVNVRAIGFEGLKARGAAAVNAVAALLNDPSPYMRGRAIFLLYQLGPEGRQRAGAPESYTDPALRIAAFRAMRRAGLDVHAGGLPRWRATPTPVSGARWRCRMRDQPAAAALDILVDIARGFDGQDRSYLEALGTGATGKEPALYERLHRELGVNGRSDRRGRPRSRESRGVCTCRRRSPDLSARARSPKLSLADRRLAMDTLAFVNDAGRVEGDARARAAERPVARAGDAGGC